MTAQLLRRLLIQATLVLCSTARAQEAPSVPEEVPLPDDELQQITLSLLERYPQLASSPGVKAAGVMDESGPGPDETVASYVIFYPHTETHGIKEAFETVCQRKQSSRTWVCDEPTIRRYLRLDSQEFEVRVKGEITSEAALALIEASRRDLNASVPASDQHNTALMVHEQWDGRIFVTWGTPQGSTGLSSIMMIGALKDGGDPTNPDDWHATVFQ
jgi:hypothetical protein